MDDYKSPTSHFDPLSGDLNCDWRIEFDHIDSFVALPSDQCRGEAPDHPGIDRAWLR